MGNDPKRVTIYTDGACIGNPGPGGYAAVLIHGERRKKLSGGYRRTTNNRMELMAPIAALRALRTKCDVTLYCDSAYVVKQMQGRVPERWARNGWKTSKKQPVLNRDLWEQLMEACAPHVVRFVRVRGHGGNVENELCDRLAKEAAMERDLPDDSGYAV